MPTAKSSLLLCTRTSEAARTSLATLTRPTKAQDLQKKIPTELTDAQAVGKGAEGSDGQRDKVQQAADVLHDLELGAIGERVLLNEQRLEAQEVSPLEIPGEPGVHLQEEHSVPPLGVSATAPGVPRLTLQILGEYQRGSTLGIDGGIRCERQ